MSLEDLDRMHSWIPRHIECFNELGKMLSEENSRRRLKEQIDLKVKSDKTKRPLKGRRLMRRLGGNPKMGGPTDESGGDRERRDGDGNTAMESS